MVRRDGAALSKRRSRHGSSRLRARQEHRAERPVLLREREKIQEVLHAVNQQLTDAERGWCQKRRRTRADKLTVIFGRKITRFYRGKLQTEIEDMHLGNPVMRSCYKNGFAKHYVRDHDLLRFETASNNITKDYGINKGMENLPALREKLQGITERYQNVQQDILETFVDRGELRALAEPTVLNNGKRIPGLKLDHARQLALMHACSISRATWSGSSTRKVFILKA